MAFSDSQLDAINAIVITVSVLSFIGSLAIIISYLKKPSFRTPSNRLVYFMAWSDLLGAFSTSFARTAIVHDLKGLCIMQAVGVQWFVVAGIVWTGVMAFQCLLTVFFSVQVSQLQRFEKLYHIFVWGLTGLPAIFIWFLDDEKGPVYGDATFLCWINSKYATYRMIFFFGPMWIVFLFNGVVYAIVIRTLTRSTKQLQAMSHQSRYAGTNAELNQDSEMTLVPHRTALPQGIRVFILKTSFYLLAFIIEWVWGTANRIQNLADPKNPIFGLFVMHAIGSSSQGLVNSVVYFGLAQFLSKKKETPERAPAPIPHVSLTRSPVPQQTMEDGNLNRKSDDFLDLYFRE